MFTSSFYNSKDNPLEVTYLWHDEGFSRNNNFHSPTVKGCKWTGAIADFTYLTPSNGGGNTNIGGQNSYFVC